MHAKEGGRVFSGRTALGGLSFGVAAVMALAQWGCGSGAGSVAGPTGAETVATQSAPDSVSVAGTWRGGDDTLSLYWRLRQDGGSVAGSSNASGDGGWKAEEGRVDGTVSGSTFTFKDIHPSGSPAASCTAQLEGTLEIHEIEHVVPPQPPYPSGYPINPPKKVTRTMMSGHVKGSTCGSPFSGIVTLFRD